MALEVGTYISDLVATNPVSGDPVSQSDDHHRLLKSTIKASFPGVTGAVTSTHTELNAVDGITAVATSAIRTAVGMVVDRAYAEYTANANLTTVIPLDDTVPQVTEGTQILSVSLTPKSATNKVRIRFEGYFALTAINNGVVAVFSGASASALASGVTSAPAADYTCPLVVEHEYVPGVTTAVTYTVRVGPGSAVTMRMNGTTAGRLLGGSLKSTLVIEEIAV